MLIYYKITFLIHTPKYIKYLWRCWFQVAVCKCNRNMNLNIFMYLFLYMNHKYRSELGGWWHDNVVAAVWATRQKRFRIFLAHISEHNHNWLSHWFVPCYLQNHALLWQDNWMRFNVEMNCNSSADTFALSANTEPLM